MLIDPSPHQGHRNGQSRVDGAGAGSPRRDPLVAAGKGVVRSRREHEDHLRGLGVGEELPGAGEAEGHRWVLGWGSELETGL